MDKIILTNNKSLEFSSIANNGNGLVITFTNQTIEALELLMTKENLSKLEISNSNSEVYGVYNNLECVSITKNLTDNSVLVNLSQLDNTQVKITDIQTQIFNLTTQLIAGGAL